MFFPILLTCLVLTYWQKNLICPFYRNAFKAISMISHYILALIKKFELKLFVFTLLILFFLCTINYSRNQPFFRMLRIIIKNLSFYNFRIYILFVVLWFINLHFIVFLYLFKFYIIKSFHYIYFTIFFI